MEIVKWIGANYQEMLVALAALVSAAQLVVRLTPTKKDDGAVERAGQWLSKVMDWLKIPNVKKK